MNRFSPEFAEKLRRKARQLGTREQFKRARDNFAAWVTSSQNMATINPFGAHYNEANTMKPHYALSAQDRSTENYSGIECPLGSPCGEPDTLLRMEEETIVCLREQSPFLAGLRRPFRPRPDRIIPILYRRPRTASEVLVEDAGEHPPTVEEQAVERVRLTLEMINARNISIPRPDWLESEPGL